MKIEEKNSDNILRRCVLDLLIRMGSKIQEGYKNEIKIDRYPYSSELYLYEAVPKQKKLFGIFKYREVTNKEIIRVFIKDNKMSIVVSDSVIYPIIKKEFTDFAETNKIEEVIFKKNFSASE